MTTYCIPALTMENEFVDLAYVESYVDTLIQRSLEYATVHRWDGDFIDGPPDAVMLRVGATWEILTRK